MFKNMYKWNSLISNPVLSKYISETQVKILYDTNLTGLIT